MMKKSNAKSGNAIQLKKSLSTFMWNKFLMKTLGLWPSSPNEFLFGLNYGYFMYHMVLEYVDLFLSISSLEQLLMNLTENMAFTQIVVRILMLRVYNKELGDLIKDCLSDLEDDYTEEEMKMLSSYTDRTRTFAKLLMTNTALTATSYYFKPILGQMDYFLGNQEGNSTYVYLLPYRFHNLVPVESPRAYWWTYSSQFPFVFVSGLGQTAADCLMVTLTFHISGQLAILTNRIENIRVEAAHCEREFTKVILKHIKLLQMGETVSDAFSITIFISLVGATSLVCILGYQILWCLANGETAILGSFFAFIFLVLLVLFAHCTVGESLITESERVNRAYYNCKWYEMPRDQAYLIVLCMLRSQKPLNLRAGKFTILYLSTFTVVIKTAMGYLSVLRTVM